MKERTQIKDKRARQKSYVDIGSMSVCLFAVVLTIFDHVYYSACLASTVHYIPDFISGFKLNFVYLPIWLGAIIALFSPSLLFKRRGRRIYCFALYCFYTILTLVDLAYYRAFNTVPSFAVIKFASSTSEMDLETIARLSRYDLLLLAGFLLFVLYIIRHKQNKNATFAKPKKRFARSALLFLLCVSAFAFLPIANTFGAFQNQYNHAFRPDKIQNEAAAISVFGYHMDDLYHFVFGREECTQDDLDLLDEYLEWNDEGIESSLQGVYKDKNLIIIQAESLESFVIGAKVGNVEVTPTLNSLLQNSLYFPNVYQQVKSGNSIDCDFIVATSILPTSYGAVFPDHAGDKFATFASSLKEAGYKTYYYNVTADSAWDYEDVICDSLNYDELISDYGDLEKQNMLNGYLSDAIMLKKTAGFIIENTREKTKVASHIVLASSHIPFNITDELKTLPEDKTLKGTTLYDYLCLMNYIDKAIGDFITELETANVLDDTVIVIYGDHGGIHRYYPIECNRISKNEEYSWVGQTTVPTVPFIVYEKNTSQTKNDLIAGQIDILPTLCSLFDVDTPKYSIGRNLLATNRSYALTTDGDIILGYGYTMGDKGYELVTKLWRLCEKLIDNDKF